MKIKKALALLLALCLTLAMVPATAFAESETSGTCGKNLTWSFDESTGTLTISGYGEMEDYDIKADFAPWWSINQQIVNVVVLDGVTTIGSYAFSDCKKLNDIVLPDSLTLIEMHAFSNCTGLSSITLPNGLTSIEASAFWGCTSLSSIVLPASLTYFVKNTFNGCRLTAISVATGNTAYSSQDGVLFDKEMSTLIYYPTCRPDSNYVVPYGVTSIDSFAFFCCPNLRSIALPDGITSIGDEAFSGCTNLRNITLPESLTSIGDLAFEVCSSLNNITLPDGLTSIGDGAFYGCSSLNSITFPAGLTSIGNYVFERCTSLSSIKFPAGLTSIGYYAFRGCTSLSSIVLPNGLASIGSCAFEGCTSLSSIMIPDTVREIASWAFNRCNSLKDVYYAGSKEKWEQIDIDNSDNGNDPLLNATIHFNSKMPGSKPEEPKPEESKTCTLDELQPIDYLALSSLSYGGRPSKMPMTVREYLGEKWGTYWENTNITYSELFYRLAGWKIVEYSEIPQNGFAAFAFTNDQGEMVVSYRGSQLEDFWNDWITNDIAMILGIYGEQINEAFNFFGRTGNVNSDKVAVTGHSLGGALAEIVAARNGIKGVSFNSAPFMDIAYGYHPKEMSEKFEGVDSYHITAYVNPDDPIGDWSLEGIKPKVLLESNEDWKFDFGDIFNNLPHMLPKMVTRDSDGKPCLTNIP